jgi:protein SCO1
MSKRNRFLVFIFITGASVIFTACGASSSERFVASPNAQRYEIAGRVVSIDRRGRQVIIAHEEIPGFMDAMTMPFTVKEDLVFDVAQPGYEIRGLLVVDGERSWIEQATVTSQPIENVNLPARTVEAQPGATVPDFALVNQDNRPVNLSEFRGKAVILTFIYTRCPLPDQCPLLSQKFAEINRELSNVNRRELAERTRLLSITFDPAYDTSRVMRDYGIRQTSSFDRWQFATGTPEQIRSVAEFFGLSYEPRSDQIIHSLRTVVIAPDGRVFRVYRNNDWTPAQAISDLTETLSL